MALNEANVQKKFESLNPTQESIETLSLWCLHHKEHHALIVSTWIKSFKTAPLKQRMSLLYVCNDVCQKERHKKMTLFRKAFSTVLKEAFSLARSQELQSTTERMLNIWKEREIFTPELINELKSVFAAKSLSNGTVKTILSKETILSDFKPEILLGDLERHIKDTENLTRLQNFLPAVPFNVDGDIKNILKDRQDGLKYVREIDAAHKKLSEFVEEFERKLLNKQKLINLLEQAEIFYETQMTEAKIVETAYRKFGSGVELVKEELNRLMHAGSLIVESNSPILDAPSPSPNDDPFAEGVEAVVADMNIALKQHSSSEPVDMEIEEDGLKVTTNRSFLSNPNSANIERLLFGSPNKEQGLTNRLLLKSPESSDTTINRQAPVWANRLPGAGSGMPNPPLPPPVPLSRLHQQHQQSPAAGPTAAAVRGQLSQVRPTNIDPRSVIAIAQSAPSGLPPPPAAPPLDRRYGPPHPTMVTVYGSAAATSPMLATNVQSQRMAAMMQPAPFFMTGPPPGFGSSMIGQNAIPTLRGFSSLTVTSPPVAASAAHSPFADSSPTLFYGPPPGALLYEYGAATSPVVSMATGPGGAIIRSTAPIFAADSRASIQSGAVISPTNPVAPHFAMHSIAQSSVARPDSATRISGPVFKQQQPQISPQATRVPQHVNHRMDWSNSPLGVCSGSGVNRSNLTVLGGGGGSNTPVRDDKEDSPAARPRDAVDDAADPPPPFAATHHDSDMRLLMRQPAASVQQPL